jgi:hypothetical protein
MLAFKEELQRKIHLRLANKNKSLRHPKELP